MNILALSFLIGIQFISLGLFVANLWMGIRLNQAVAWLATGTLLAGLVWGWRTYVRKFSLVSWTRPEKLIAGLLIIVVVSAFITAFWYPVTDWDAVTLYDFRAKVITSTGWIRDTLPRAGIADYPLLTSLGHWWISALGLPTPMPLYPAIYGSFLAVSYGLFRRRLNRIRALMAVLFLAAAPKLFDQSLVAYANLPYTVYLIIGSGYLAYWTRDHHRSDLFLGLLFSLCSLWARSFPFFIINILAAVIANPQTRKWGITAGLIGAAGLIISVWPVNWLHLGKVIDFLKWGIIEYYLPYSLLLTVLLFDHFWNKSGIGYWPILICGYYLLLLAGTYQYGLRDPGFAAIPDALQRTFMFINPAISWYAVEKLYQKK